ncbi:hypothetical protein JCM9534A_55720 [Catenuloplanes indicus JCM 9534]|uniref:ABC-type lipoprotein export system ATPase subunit n=1 Tax=Catenuloplanes indicus TaxID=137267 RepID=A0AAE3W5R4_9ACTN|nr:ABC-type lipoprotein export system ATPase subunit [Catenuloplanes indicus]
MSLPSVDGVTLGYRGEPVLGDLPVTAGEEPSGGRRQRTAPARGPALAGDVLLADEVTSELDAANRARVLELLRAEAERGAAAVFATHDAEAAAFCDAELLLRDGSAEPLAIVKVAP